MAKKSTKAKSKPKGRAKRAAPKKKTFTVREYGSDVHTCGSFGAAEAWCLKAAGNPSRFIITDGRTSWSLRDGKLQAAA